MNSILKALVTLLKEKKQYTGEDVRQVLLATHDQFDPGEYWRFKKEGQFMTSFVQLACEYIIKNFHKDSIIKDICGGNGTLGIGLAMYGFSKYILLDYNKTFLKWGQLLFEQFGMRLKNKLFNVITDESSPHDADIVTLLGWENFDFSYQRAFIVARNHLKSNGFFLFTFQDDDAVQASEWEEYFANYHQNWDRLNKPGIGYYLANYGEIETWLRYAGFAPMWRQLAHTNESSNGTVYPQYLVLARPMETALKGKAIYSTKIIEKNADKLLSSDTTSKDIASLAQYQYLLQALQALPHVSIVPMKKLVEASPKSREILIGLRHDVDSNLHMAYRCAEIESSLRLSGTYFILPTSADYYGFGKPEKNTFYRYSGIAEALLKIQNLGAEIAWHDDFLAVLLYWRLDPAEFMKNELSFLRDNGLKIIGTVSHCSLNSYGGVSNFEFFYGQTISGRRWAPSGNNLIPVGRYNLNEFGFEYDANCILQARTSHREVVCGNYREDAGKLELLHSDYTLRIRLDRDIWRMGSFPLYFEELSIEDIISFIAHYPISAKFVIDSHPEHFYDDV